MQNKKNDWLLTDDDCFQICRKVRDGLYELFQINSRKPSWENDENAFGVAHAFIDTKDADIADLCMCYGYQSLNEIKETYGSEWEQIIAECMFELEAYEHMIETPDMTYDEAKALIIRMSGFLSVQEAGDRPIVKTVLGDEEMMFTVCNIPKTLEKAINDTRQICTSGMNKDNLDGFNFAVEEMISILKQTIHAAEIDNSIFVHSEKINPEHDLEEFDLQDLLGLYDCRIVSHFNYNRGRE